MAFFAITGLQYAGAKTLFTETRKVVQESPNFLFYNYHVTEASGDQKDGQVVLTEQEFEDKKDDGTILSSWKENGINYGIAKDSLEAAEAGKFVVVVVPREQFPSLEKTASNISVEFKVVNICPTHENLTARAMEVEGKNFNEKNFIKNKLKKFEEIRGENVIKVENNGTVEEGVKELIAAIGFDPLLHILPKEGGESGIDLKTCSPQDYLKATLYPFLNPALEKINRERPEDPVEFLAMYLYNTAATTKLREKELVELKKVKSSLRDKIKKEYQIIGRV